MQARVHRCATLALWALATTVHVCFHMSWDLDLEALMVPGSSCCFGLRVVLGGHRAGWVWAPHLPRSPDSTHTLNTERHCLSPSPAPFPLPALTSSLTPTPGSHYPQVPLLQEALPAAPGFREGVSLSGFLGNILGSSQRFPICPHQHAMSPEGWDYVRSTRPHPFPWFLGSSLGGHPSAPSLLSLSGLFSARCQW